MSRIVLLCLLALPGSAMAGSPIVVFAAASLHNALDAVVTAYEEQTGQPVTVSYAGSATLARQIVAGAPADIYLSANQAWMDYLQEKQLVQPRTRQPLLTNRLVLIAPENSTVQLSIKPHFDLLAALQGGHLAMANTRAVPAGIYGRQSLQHLGVWATVKNRIVQTANVRVALAYVEQGAVPLGIVYASGAVAAPQVRVVGTFPADSHEPIVYPVAVTTHSGHPQAQHLLDFLHSPQAAAAFKRWGFCVSKQDSC